MSVNRVGAQHQVAGELPLHAETYVGGIWSSQVAQADLSQLVNFDIANREVPVIGITSSLQQVGPQREGGS